MFRVVCQLFFLERLRSLEFRVGRDYLCCWFKIWFFRLDGDRVYKNFVFQEDVDYQEYEVEVEYDEIQYFVYSLFVEGDGEDDEEQYDEEEDDGVEEVIVVDGYWLEFVNDGVQELGQREFGRERSGGRSGSQTSGRRRIMKQQVDMFEIYYLKRAFCQVYYDAGIVGFGNFIRKLGEF